MKKILTSDRDVAEKQVDDRAVPGGGFIVTGRPPGLSAVQYIEKYGTVEEITELASRIEARRSKLPRWIYRICDSCGWRSKLPFGDRDIQKSERPEYCFRCNRPGYVDGAVMREMTPSEVRTFEREAARKESEAREREFRGAFFRENQRRAELGLPAFTEAEFRAHRKRQWAERTGAAWRAK